MNAAPCTAAAAHEEGMTASALHAARDRSYRGLRFAAALFAVAILIALVHTVTNAYGFDIFVLAAALMAGVASWVIIRVLYIAERREAEHG